MKKITKNVFHKEKGAKESEDKKKASESLHKLEHVIKKVHSIYQINTVFPFYIFPVTIAIDEEKVSIIYRNFFFSEQVVQILLKDIKSVQLDTDVFFGKLQIHTTEPVSFLWKHEAIKARRIIEGMVILANEDVDPTLFDTNELRKKAEEIGKAKEGKKAKDVI